MWAIAEKVPREIFSSTTVDPRAFNIDDEKTWTLPKLQNAKLLEMAREIQSTGIGTLEEVYSSIIPLLSFTSKLPDEAIVELVRERALDYETDCRWEKAYNVYYRLLDLSQKRKSSTDRLVHKAVAAAIEFLIQATTEPLAEDRDTSYKDVEDLKAIKGKLVEMLKGPHLRCITVRLRALYMNQSRSEQYDSLFKDENMRAKDETLVGNYEYNQDTDVLGWNKRQYDTLTYSLLMSYPSALNILDIAGRSILFYAIMKNNSHLVTLLLREGANVNLKGRDGMTPVHWAARLGDESVIESLFRMGAKWDTSDNFGRTPLTLAA
jgi:Ankyrin repeats (3 copies)